MAAQWPAWTPTRFKYLGLSRVERSLYRWVCLDFEGGGTRPDAPACIGPHYRTQAEALADLQDYAAGSYPDLA